MHTGSVLKCVSACLVALLLVQTSAVSVAQEAGATGSSYNPMSWFEKDKSVDLGFADVLHRPFYEKTAFPWAVLVASIIVFAVFSYVTAGAGAPAAAPGVSTVASLVGGGGAGSYMAGLSTIGSLVGGNAMTGAAILNGISAAITGSTAALASLSVAQKAVVFLSVAAIGLDGFLVFAPPDAKDLEYRVLLSVPHEVGTGSLAKLIKEMDEADKAHAKTTAKFIEAAEAVGSTRQKALERELKGAAEKREAMVNRALAWAERARKDATHPADLVALAVISHNAGKYELSDNLLQRAAGASLGKQGYLQYVQAVRLVEENDWPAAEEKLWEAWRSDRFAAEPPLLLANLIIGDNIKKREKHLLALIRQAETYYDNDKYKSPYSLLGLYYRVAVAYYRVDRLVEAEKYFQQAEDDLPLTQKSYWPFGDKQVLATIRTGKANSIYMQGRKIEAFEIIEDLLNNTESESIQAYVRQNYVGKT